MDRNSIIEKTREIVAKHLEVAPAKVTLDANPYSDLGADSLDVIEIIMEVEVAFEIEISDDEAAGAESLRAIVDVVAKKLGVAEPADG